MDKIFADTVKMLNYRSLRQEIIAKNLANSDTPGYKSQDLISAFQSTLQLNMTHQQHIAMSNSVNGNKVYESSDQGNIDGNNVNVDQEMLKFTENTMHYQMLLNNIKNQVQMLKQAIRG